MLTQAEQYEYSLDVFYRRAQAYMAAGDPANAAVEFKKIMVIADGVGGPYTLHSRNSASRGPTPCKEGVRAVAERMSISSPPGETRIRISRSFVKPKPNTPSSPQPHPPPLQHRGKTSSLYSMHSPRPRSCRKSDELRPRRTCRVPWGRETRGEPHRVRAWQLLP